MNDDIKSILLKGENPCSGCGVCEVICPSSSITISLNADGFYEPEVGTVSCTNCGFCQKVCYKYIVPKPIFENCFKDKPIFGVWNRDVDILKTSSSGGAVQEIVNYALANGYTICGVIFDAKTDFCYHDLSVNKTETAAFRGSKYLQSFTPNAFKQFEKDKKYLVVGTPCQIHGLRKFTELKKWEHNFLLVDFFCHGTPTLNLWKKYKEYISKKQSLEDVSEMKFREKGAGWHPNTIMIKDSKNKEFISYRAFKKDLFFNFFLSDTCLADSCYECLLRLDYCYSDIRVGDFWGEKYKKNERGVTLLITNTDFGEKIFNQIENKLIVEKASFSDLMNSQGNRFLNKAWSSSKVMELMKGKKPLYTIFMQTIMASILIKKWKIILKRFIKRMLLRR
jgi:coenzyme F420-reducing hydrogenase beta subunit